MAALHFRCGGEVRQQAEALVRRHHYSKTCGSAIACVGTWHLDGGLFGDMGDVVAACFFGWPPARWSEEVLELVRLVRDGRCTVPLSALVAQTVRHVARKRLCDLLVSYADPLQGHHGGIYQACSWHYHGVRKSGATALLVNGTYIPRRMVGNLYGTSSIEKVQALLGANHTVTPVMDAGKHLYWKPLTRSGKAKATRLELRADPYPKPEWMVP